MSTTNIIVSKKSNEPAMSLLRRFQKKIQESGILPKVRSNRYATRELSDLKVKLGKIKKLNSAAKYTKMKRLGMAIETKKRR